MLILKEYRTRGNARNFFLEKNGGMDNINKQYCVKEVNFTFFKSEQAARKYYNKLCREADNKQN